MACIKEFQIVSPPFACGVAWLINILLELNIKMTNVNFSQNHWTENSEGKSLIGNDAKQHLRWHLPVFYSNNIFNFDKNIEGFWEHRLDLAKHTNRPTILFIRDPRDAIYSLYVRNYQSHITFLEFLKKPDIWPDHFPDLFNLPPAETFALFCLFWEQLKNLLPIHIVRFEDMRANPIKEMTKILDFLDITRRPADIEDAIYNSSFEKTKETVKKLLEETGQQYETTRRGKINEWQEVYDNEMLSFFNTPLVNFMMVKFGYKDHVSSYVAIPTYFIRASLKIRDNIVLYFLMKYAALKTQETLDNIDSLFVPPNIILAIFWCKKIFGHAFINDPLIKKTIRFFLITNRICAFK